MKSHIDVDPESFYTEIQELLAQANSGPEQSRRISVRPSCRGQRPPSSRITSSSSMRSVGGSDMTSPNPGLGLTGASTPPIIQRPAADPKTGLRPLSMLIGPVVDMQLPMEKAREEEELKQKEREAAAEKRAKRGLSLNWSSFAGFGASASPPAKQSPRTEDMSFTEEPETLKEGPSPRREEGNSPLGVKLEPHEEDEQDRIERERLAATMKLLGVSPAPSRGSSGATSPAASGSTLLPPEAGPSGVRRSKSAMSTSSARTSDNGSRTPLSRLSSFFGRSPIVAAAAVAEDPVSENEDPHAARGDLAEIVEKAAREREEEEKRKYARKKNWRQSFFAKPEVHDVTVKDGEERRGSVDLMGSLEEVRSPAAHVEMGHTKGKESKSSVSTLFDASN